MMIPKRKQEIKQDSVGLGLETKSTPMSTFKSITTGTKSATTSTKNHLKRNAHDALNTGLPKISKVIQDLKRGNPMHVAENDSWLPRGAFARLEQLLESSKSLIEELSERKIPSGAAGASSTGLGIQPNNAQRNSLLTSYGKAVDTKIDNINQRHGNTFDVSSGIAPGTGRVDKATTKTYADAKRQGSENNAETQARKTAEFQQKQNENQG